MSDYLEDHLKKALSRQEAPDGFAERVLTKVPPRRSGPSAIWYPAVAAAVVVALLFTGVKQRQLQEERHARDTERQVVFALALAIHKFEHVNERLQQSAPKVKVQERQGTL